MTRQRRGGPAKLKPSEALALFAEQRWASFCFEAADGCLCTSPAWVVGASPDTAELMLPGESGADPESELGACLVADRFETYTGIVGLIIRGTLEASEHRTRTLSITRLHGFSFENTTIYPGESKGP
jgi:hypothetical protein